ncbi:MAG: DUF3024 domain-containing protein [Thermoleophilaceae bacterium]
MAQLRYDLERDVWTLHHGDTGGWCSYDDAVESSELAPLLDVVGSDRGGRFRGLGEGYGWPWEG